MNDSQIIKLSEYVTRCEHFQDDVTIMSHFVLIRLKEEYNHFSTLKSLADQFGEFTLDKKQIEFRRTDTK